MIVAERKPLEDLYAHAKKHKKVLLLGCGTCVTVCMAGGEKEVGILASQMAIAARERGDDIAVTEHTITRQCDSEFFDEATARKVEEADAIISLGCGVGVQFCAERFPDKPVYPGLNTKFYGATLEQGVWAERCAGCGECVLDKFGGVCPVARCSKSLFNGPCGGSSGGKCEIDKNVDCVWHLIVTKMMEQGELDKLNQLKPVKNWLTSRDGGPRKIVREDLKL